MQKIKQDEAFGFGREPEKAKEKKELYTRAGISKTGIIWD